MVQACRNFCLAAAPDAVAHVILPAALATAAAPQALAQQMLLETLDAMQVTGQLSYWGILP